MLPERNILLISDDSALGSQCQITFTKGTGPGGQKRNKTSSAVTVSLPGTDFSAGDCTERSQIRNRTNALRKLRMQIALAIRNTPAEVPRRMDCSISSPEYPLFAAQLLDVFHESGCDHKVSAEKCGISPSAFLKKLYRDPLLWQHIQKMRKERDLPPLSPPK